MGDALAELSRQLGDRYLIERELGRGGMGAVYLARDRRLDRPVALKVLPSEFAIVPELRERFLRETRLAAGFSHPNIVPVFAIEETDEVLAFAMGFVEGESLAARVTREGALSRRDAVRLLQDVGYALAYAHGRGVVHRDIKPDNVMVERATGRALVMDFGIARAITPVADKPGLTRVGEVVGTPEYMSPEQAAGEAVDGRADLYSLGLVAWFALTGRTAVTGESTQRILVKQLTEAIPPLASERPDLPATLCDVVDRCCAKEADDRFENAEALVEALDAAQLSTPEIPVAIRLLLPDLSTAATRTFIAVVLLAYGTTRLVTHGAGNFFSFGLVAGAMAWVATLSALQEVRRLRRGGYTAAQLQKLLDLTLTERADERARRRLDAALVARRKRRVIIAAALLVFQLGTLYSMLRGVSAGGNVDFNNKQAVTFFGALLGSALAATILISSPFRMPVTEQLTRAFWLARPGHWVLRTVGGRMAPADGVGVSPARRPTTAPAIAVVSARAATPSVASLAADVQVLRQRVDALEQRR